MRFLLATGLTIVLGACATSAPGSSSPSPGKVTAAMEGQMSDDGSVIKCRSMQVTGSRFPVRECKSETAWLEFDKLMAENAKSSTDKFQRLKSGCATQSEGTC